jgi:hypothetical protein
MLQQTNPYMYNSFVLSYVYTENTFGRNFKFDDKF